MTRQIKFRAWDKKLKLMMDWETISKEMGIGIHTLNFPSSLGFMFQQYTGLKDNKGNEIYEGDILREDWGENGEYELYTVGFANGAFVPNPEDTGFEFPLWGLTDDYEATVVGNIYEHPNLLKNK